MAVAQKTRYRWLDLLRGAAVVNMVAFHVCYDWFEVFARLPGWYFLWPSRLWQQAICCTFILASGFSTCLGRRALRHGLILNLCGFGVSAVTLLALPGEAVRFGVLNLLGCGALLVWALRPALEKLPAAVGFGGSLFLFALTRHLPEGYLGFLGLWRQPLPAGLYRWNALAFLGLPGPTFSSSDYFPLAPWSFLFLAGWFICRLARPRLEGFLPRLAFPPLEWAGRHSLAVYLVHQPVCMAVCWLLALVL